MIETPAVPCAAPEKECCHCQSVQIAGNKHSQCCMCGHRKLVKKAFLGPDWTGLPPTTPSPQDFEYTVTCDETAMTNIDAEDYPEISLYWPPPKNV